MCLKVTKKITTDTKINPAMIKVPKTDMTTMLTLLEEESSLDGMSVREVRNRWREERVGMEKRDRGEEEKREREDESEERRGSLVEGC